MSRLFGTYDSKGNFVPQKVTIGKLANGNAGLFTNGFLAWSLTQEEYKLLECLDHVEISKFIMAKGFMWENHVS